jgi:hypothetical protein
MLPHCLNFCNIPLIYLRFAVSLMRLKWQKYHFFFFFYLVQGVCDFFVLFLKLWIPRKKKDLKLCLDHLDNRNKIGNICLRRWIKLNIIEKTKTNRKKKMLRGGSATTCKCWGWFSHPLGLFLFLFFLFAYFHYLFIFIVLSWVEKIKLI